MLFDFTLFSPDIQMTPTSQDAFVIHALETFVQREESVGLKMAKMFVCMYFHVCIEYKKV